MCSLQENRPKTTSATHTRTTLGPLDCGAENDPALEKTNSLRAPARASQSTRALLSSFTSSETFSVHGSQRAGGGHLGAS